MEMEVNEHMGEVEDYILTESPKRLRAGYEQYGAWPLEDPRDLLLEANSELIDTLHYFLAHIRELTVKNRRLTTVAAEAEQRAAQAESHVNELQERCNQYLDETRLQRIEILELRASMAALMRDALVRDELVAVFMPDFTEPEDADTISPPANTEEDNERIRQEWLAGLIPRASER